MDQKNRENLTKFFGAIFAGAEGYIDIRTFVHIKEEGGIKTLQKDHFFIKIKELKDSVRILSNENFTKGKNIHFGVAPRAKSEEGEKQTGAEKDIKMINCLWSDVDCKRESNPNLPTKKVALKRIENFELPPSIIVDSGLGYQCYWLLKMPIPIKSRKIFLEVKGILKGLTMKLGGDVAGHDLCRLLRVPGTSNIKPECPLGLPVKIIKFEPALKYGPEFKKFMVKVEDISGIDIDIKDVKIPQRFEKLLQGNRKLRDTYLTKNRPDLSDQTGSGYDMALVNILIKNGFSDSEIGAILRSSKTGKGKKATRQYLALTIGKGRAFKEKSKTKFSPRPYSNEILETHFLRYDLHKRFWIYDQDSGIWSDKAEIILNSILRKKILGEKDFKVYCVSEIIADLQGLTLETELPEEPPAYLIPFKNKIYDFKNKKLIDYSPEYFFINKLKVDFSDTKGECPTIDKIFRQIVREKDVISLYETLGYAMWRGYPYPKIFILYGSGGNGKTAYIKILERVLGKENISLENSLDLQWNRFSIGRLYGKLLNVSSEMEYSILKNTVSLKMATGEDLVDCERKFREPFAFTNYAKLVFLTNQIPLTADRTFAFFRRIFLLEFPNKFVLGKNADPDIVDKIDKKEFETLGYLALAKLGQLRSNRFVFSRHEETEKVRIKYESLSNPLIKFLEDFVVREPNSDIPKIEFQKTFEDYLRDKGYRIWLDKEISQRMRESGYREKMLTGESSTYRAWVEITWK